MSMADEYRSLADTYARQSAHNPVQTHYDRPAILALVGDIRDKRVLELGCAAGLLTEQLVHAGADVLAIDREPCSVGRSRASSASSGKQASPSTSSTSHSQATCLSARMPGCGSHSRRSRSSCSFERFASPTEPRGATDWCGCPRFMGCCFIKGCRRASASHGERPVESGDSPVYLDEAATAITHTAPPRRPTPRNPRMCP